MSVDERRWSVADDHDLAFEERVAAQALGSIEPDDAALLAAHLPRCERCRQLRADFGAVVEALPLSVEPAPSNQRLKSRLMAAIYEDGAAGELDTTPADPLAPDGGPAVASLGDRSAPAGPDQPADEPGAPVGRPAARSRVRQFWWALPLAAMVLISIGLGWWGRGLQSELQAQRELLQRQDRLIGMLVGGDQRVALVGTEQAPAARGEVIQPRDGGPPLLLARGLPALTSTQVYQVWLINGGRTIGAGLLGARDGAVTVVTLDRSLTGAEQVALTVEPPGGSPAPTGPIVLAGKV
jgi:anti-sigma-K factor RskA